jgi:cbb3-type cytochrome oxidase subunit 3
MDVNDIRVAVTVIGLLAFLALVVHTWSRRRKSEHDEAARLPFIGEDEPANRGEHP